MLLDHRVLSHLYLPSTILLRKTGSSVSILISYSQTYLYLTQVPTYLLSHTKKCKLYGKIIGQYYPVEKGSSAAGKVSYNLICRNEILKAF